MNKDFKIWGVSYGLIGDLIMGLPVLNYFEKKYPGSYKNWVVQKKCAQCSDLFINHPLIDRIKITDEWDGMGTTDQIIFDECNVKTPWNQNHKISDWYNHYNCVEETAKLAGIEDLKEILSGEELVPRLNKWFDIGLKQPVNTGYSQVYDSSGLELKKTIAIWPFANYFQNPQRSPSLKWWSNIVNILVDLDYKIHHFGYMTEPDISNSKNYTRYTDRSFSEQIKIALSSNLCIGTDSGSMWVMGAYEHPSICLMTYWMPNHKKNPLSLMPVNKNSKVFFNENSCDDISVFEVLSYISSVGV